MSDDDFLNALDQWADYYGKRAEESRHKANFYLFLMVCFFAVAFFWLIGMILRLLWS